MKTWLITGCSSGLGRSLAEAVLAAGDNAVVTARDAERVEDLAAAFPDTALACALDVTDPDSVARAVAAAESSFGTVDVLANNAGYSYRSAIEEGEPDEVDALFATNLFGPLAMIKAVLPGMRARRAGTIVNVSSVAGQLSIPASGYYSATKFALEGTSEALRQEVAPLGIRVMIVVPGAFRTDFYARSLRGTRNSIADYAETVGPRRKENDHSTGTHRGDPVKGAAAIVETVARPELPRRLLLGSDAAEFVAAELTARLDEIARWRDVSLSTDYA